MIRKLPRPNKQLDIENKLEGTSTHKSAKTHGGNVFFVTRDLDLRHSAPKKTNIFSGAFVRQGQVWW